MFAPGHCELVHAHMARLTVLYEDLRIELTAGSEASIPVLDATDPSYRRIYFLRRSIATLIEFAETIRLLDECPEFQTVKQCFGRGGEKYWESGLRFFKRHEPFLERVRNDIGGHFGPKAAIYAIVNLESGTSGQIELRDKTEIHFNFAEQIVAAAFFRQLQGSTAAHKFTRLMRIVQIGFRHGTRCTRCVAYGYLWERFGH